MKLKIYTNKNKKKHTNYSLFVKGSVEFFTINDSLITFDPYDIWKTKPGLFIKILFNKNKAVAAAPALIFTLYDQFFNNKLRFGYIKQEYPIVRALAAQNLMNLYEKERLPIYLEFTKKHLDWLVKNSSKGYSGHCWGLGIKWPASKDIIYEENTPHSTHTPYVLEAFHKYTQITDDNRYVPIIKSCFDFYEQNLKILANEKDSMAISYGPFKDRIVTNAVSYTILAYSIFLNYFPERSSYIKSKINKFYNFIKKYQNSDGSWLYAPLEKDSFIDCFHSCIVIKNLIKTKNHVHDSEILINKGYEYIKKNFYNEKERLFKRFSKENKPSLIKFDLYDNSEVLILSKLMFDNELATNLEKRIFEVFVKNEKTVYSSLNIFGKLINKNTLRWAVMPYLFSISIKNLN